MYRFATLIQPPFLPSSHLYRFATLIPPAVFPRFASAFIFAFCLRALFSRSNFAFVLAFYSRVEIHIFASPLPRPLFANISASYFRYPFSHLISAAYFRVRFRDLFASFFAFVSVPYFCAYFRVRFRVLFPFIFSSNLSSLYSNDRCVGLALLHTPVIKRSSPYLVGAPCRPLGGGRGALRWPTVDNGRPPFLLADLLLILY